LILKTTAAATLLERITITIFRSAFSIRMPWWVCAMPPNSEPLDHRPASGIPFT
jgi:hypothetical protein